MLGAVNPQAEKSELARWSVGERDAALVVLVHRDGVLVAVLAHLSQESREPEALLRRELERDGGKKETRK